MEKSKKNQLLVAGEVEMLPLVEQYVKENHKTNYAMKWSEWKKHFK